jgi:hypothetical protein
MKCFLHDEVVWYLYKATCHSSYSWIRAILKPEKCATKLSFPVVLNPFQNLILQLINLKNEHYFFLKSWLNNLFSVFIFETFRKTQLYVHRLCFKATKVLT